MIGCIQKRGIAIIAGALLVLVGSNLQAEPPPEPKIVRKKIVPPSEPLPPAVQKDESRRLPKAPVTTDKETDQAEAQKQAEKGPAKVEEQPTAKISETAQMKLSAAITPLYDPTGKIDPFEPLIKKQAERKAVKKKIKRREPRTPLEKMDFSQMKLVAIIQSPRGNRAMVEEATGKGYIVSKGTYMGLNSGKVIQILKDRVVIEETVENVLGKVVSQKRELKLQKPPGDF